MRIEWGGVASLRCSVNFSINSNFLKEKDTDFDKADDFFCVGESFATFYCRQAVHIDREKAEKANR
jgi:hypothetical protein